MRTFLIISFVILVAVRLSGVESGTLPQPLGAALRYATSLEGIQSTLKLTYDAQVLEGEWTSAKRPPTTVIPEKVSIDKLLIGPFGRYKHEVWVNGAPSSIATSCLGTYSAMSVQLGTLFTGGPGAFHSAVGHPPVPIFIPIGYAIYPGVDAIGAMGALCPTIYTAVLLGKQAQGEAPYASFFVRVDPPVYADGESYNVIFREEELSPFFSYRIDVRGSIAPNSSSEYRVKVSDGDSVIREALISTTWINPVSSLDAVVPKSIFVNILIDGGEKVGVTRMYTLTAAEVIGDSTDEDFMIDAALAKSVISLAEPSE